MNKEKLTQALFLYIVWLFIVAGLMFAITEYGSGEESNSLLLFCIIFPTFWVGLYFATILFSEFDTWLSK